MKTFAGVLRLHWSFVAWAGSRRFWRLVQRFPTMRNTTFWFEGPAVAGKVALTIDDGLCSHGLERALVKEVAKLLKERGAKATFFLCSDHLVGLEDEARSLASDGHEFANHMVRDREYASMPSGQFEDEMQEVSSSLQRLSGKAIHWFRAPQARYTKTMKATVENHGMRHALGDAYCDDWAIEDAGFVSRTLLKMVRPGSIIILHMPEKGYREHTLQALDDLLDGLSARGLACHTLSDLEAAADSHSSTTGHAGVALV